MFLLSGVGNPLGIFNYSHVIELVLKKISYLKYYYIYKKFSEITSTNFDLQQVINSTI